MVWVTFTDWDKSDGCDDVIAPLIRCPCKARNTVYTLFSLITLEIRLPAMFLCNLKSIKTPSLCLANPQTESDSESPGLGSSHGILALFNGALPKTVDANKTPQLYYDERGNGHDKSDRLSKSRRTVRRINIKYFFSWTLRWVVSHKSLQ